MFLLPVFAFVFISQTRSCHACSQPGFRGTVLSWFPTVLGIAGECLALVLILAKFLCDECGILDDNSVKMRVTSWGNVEANWGLLWVTFKWVRCFRWVDIGLDSFKGSVLQLHYLCEIWDFSPCLSSSLSVFFFKVGRMWKRLFSVGTLSERLITKDVCVHSGVVISVQQFAHIRCYTNCFCALSHLKLSAISWRRRNHFIHVSISQRRPKFWGDSIPWTTQPGELGHPS